jgi:hypothetical protein
MLVVNKEFSLNFTYQILVTEIEHLALPIFFNPVKQSLFLSKKLCLLPLNFFPIRVGFEHPNDQNQSAKIKDF